MIPKWTPVNLSRFRGSSFILFIFIFHFLFASCPGLVNAQSAPDENPSMTIRELYEAGTAALQRGESKKALMYFEKVKEVNPDIPQLYNLIGMTHLELKESAHDAIAAFEQAIKLDPAYAEAYNHLGVIYSTIVLDHELAEEYFLEALRIDSNFARAHFGLGWLYLIKQKNAELGEKYLTKAVELTPDFVEAQYYLGVAFVMNGNKHRAIGPITALKSLAGGKDYANTLQLMMNQETDLIKEKMLA